MERLQKYLSECGISSRRKCEKLILSGKVKVNNEVVTTLGTKVSSKDIVTVNNIDVVKEEKEYYLLYKPEKVITSVKDEKNRVTVIDYINTKTKIYPVGRLDYDTSGLLLLTNDGFLTNDLIHPKNNVEKTYAVKIDGLIESASINQLENGIVIDNVMTKKCKVKLKKKDFKNKKSYLEITITEGRNHEIKNMFSYFGHKVLKLKRINFAFLNLDGLKIGEYRSLTSKEVKKLYSLVQK